MRSRGWCIPCGLVLVMAVRTVAAQGLPDEWVGPGATTATVTGAETLRVNPAAMPFNRDWSLRLHHVGEVRAHDTPFNGDALSFTSPLPFGLAAGLGVSWGRPGLTAASLPGGGNVGAYGTGEIGLAWAIDRRLAIGLRWRIFGAFEPAPASPVFRLDGQTALDLGIAWHPTPEWGLAVVARSLAGPQEPSVGLDRLLLVGLGWRPTGTNAFTVGVDGVLPEHGGRGIRAGVRVEIPSFGALRGDGFVDLDHRTWRAALGIEVGWGRAMAGVGGFAGSQRVAGYQATLGLDGDRGPGFSSRLVVTVPMDGSPTARAMGALLWRLERLRRDPAVRAVVFAPRADVGGLAHAEELREAFAMLQRSGVKVVCHLTEATGSTYYACAGADQVTVDVAGGVRLMGLRASRYYLGQALWSLGVRTDFVRIGDWKSAPEQLTRYGSTPPSRAQEAQLLDDYFATLVGGLASSLHVTADQARALVVGGPYTAREAREHGMAQAVGTRETAQRAAQRLAGGGSLVDYEDYVAPRGRRWAPGPAVAVIYIDGDLVDGDSYEIPLLGLRFIGDRTIVRAIEAAARSSRVGAIVLRVDSPGGSALASDLIWRAVAAAARRKPVVASFGRVAASGGYYLGSAAEEIFADPSCVTGSIGIFYGKADVARLLTRLDIGTELSRRGEHADMESIFRPYTDEERAMLAQKIGEFYELFLQRVAAGRHVEPRAVDAVGQGRVFAGTRALNVHLVDHLGGLGAALRRARELGRLPEDYEVVELPAAPQGLLGQLVDLLVADDHAAPAARLLAGSELAVPLAWLWTVSRSIGRPLAMVDWPMEGP